MSDPAMTDSSNPFKGRKIITTAPGLAPSTENVFSGRGVSAQPMPDTNVSTAQGSPNLVPPAPKPYSDEILKSIGTGAANVGANVAGQYPDIIQQQ